MRNPIQIVVVLSMGTSLACERGVPLESASKLSIGEIRLLTQAFVTGCVETSMWTERFAREQGRPPVLRVRGVQNKTFDDIDTAVIDSVLAEAFVAAGKVEVAAASRPADFMLTGTLSYGTAPGAGPPTVDGHRQFVGRFSVVHISDGQPVCSAAGSVNRLIHG